MSMLERTARGSIEKAMRAIGGHSRADGDGAGTETVVPPPMASVGDAGATGRHFARKDGTASPPGRVPRAGALRWRIQGRNPARRPLPCRCGPQGPAIEALMRNRSGHRWRYRRSRTGRRGAGGSRSRAQRPMSADGSAWDATGGRWSAERTMAGRSTSCVPAGGATAARGRGRGRRPRAPFDAAPALT